MDHVDASQVNSDLPDLAELFQDQGFTQMAAVQQDAAVYAVARGDLGVLGPGDHVPRRQLHHVGSILLHEALSVLIQQIGAFASGGLGHQDPVAGQGGRMVLDHLHVHQTSAGVVGQGHAVAGDNQRVGAGLEDPAQSAGAQNYGLGANRKYLPGAYLQCRYSTDPAVFLDEAGHEPLFIPPDARLD